MSKSEKNAFFSKPFNGPLLIFWNLILHTFLCTKIKKFTMEHFFSLDACLSPMCPYKFDPRPVEWRLTVAGAAAKKLRGHFKKLEYTR